MKTYYSDYAAHCARYYFAMKSLGKTYNDPNFVAVVKALRLFNDQERRIIQCCYTTNNLTLAIEKIKKQDRVKTGYVWKVITRFEKAVATYRGLV